MSLSCSPTECAALHNQLLHKITQHANPLTLERGLVEEALDAVPDLALILPNIEHTPFYQFLSLCDTYNGPQGRDTLPLTPQTAQPHGQDFLPELLPIADQAPFLVLLYPSHVGPGRARDVNAGLLLDPVSLRAHWHFLPTSGNNNLAPAHHWEPLDHVLRLWLAAWDRGKYYWDEELQYPRIRTWTEHDLTESLAAWEALLACIAERRPPSQPSPLQWQQPLDRTQLSQFPMSQFAVEFLSRAKRPPFALVAPGITVFSEESLAAAYAAEPADSWRRRWMETAEPDEWPSLFLPMHDGLPVPSGGLVDERFDQDWGVGKLTVNRLPGLYLDAAVEDADSVFFVTELGRADVLDYSRGCP